MMGVVVLYKNCKRVSKRKMFGWCYTDATHNKQIGFDGDGDDVSLCTVRLSDEICSITTLETKLQKSPSRKHKPGRVAIVCDIFFFCFLPVHSFPLVLILTSDLEINLDLRPQVFCAPCLRAVFGGDPSWILFWYWAAYYHSAVCVFLGSDIDLQP